MSSEPDQETDIRVIPPAIFLIALIFAFMANWLWPLSFVPDIIRYTLGPGLIITSIAVMPSVFAAFRRADTPYDVRQLPKALVTKGAFNCSRNPGYVALAAISFGLGALMDNPWVLPTTIGAILYIQVVIIPVEEKHLEARFGGDYRRYKSKVRRWL